MEENKETILSFNYLFENIKPKFNKISVENKEYPIENLKDLKIRIKFNDIESELCTKVVNLTLIFGDGDDDKESHDFEVIPGNLTGILFPSWGYTRDLIFSDNNNYNVEIYQTNDKTNKKEFIIKNNRLLLINISREFYLYINKAFLTSQIIKLSNENSLQVYIADLSNRIFFSKIIVKQNFNLFFDIYNESKSFANYFYQEIESLLIKPKINMGDFKALFENDNENANLTNIFFIKLNFPKQILHNNYNKIEYFEFTSICSLFLIFEEFCLDNFDEKEIKSIFKFFNEFKKRLENEKYLENYMKSIIMMEFTYLMKNIKNVEKFKKIEFTYYNLNNLEEESPLFIAITFLKKLIEDLDDINPFIYPLILIDSGNYYYNGENAFEYGLTNKEILKKHLLDVLPDILITINNEENSTNQAYTNKVIGSVIFNLGVKSLSPLKYFKLNKNVENRDIRNKLALIIFITFFYEVLGYIKSLYSSNSQKDNEILLSRNAFYDKKKFDFNNDIKILRNTDRYASHFLEYFIGECEYGFYIDLIDELLLENINLNFILDNDLWNKKIDKLRKYIKIKYMVFCHDKNLLDKRAFNNINDEIIYLENIIIQEKIQLSVPCEINVKEQNKDETIPKSKKEVFFSKPINNNKKNEELEKLSFGELKKIAFNKKISSDLTKAAIDILFSRIIRIKIKNK